MRRPTPDAAPTPEAGDAAGEDASLEAARGTADKHVESDAGAPPASAAAAPGPAGAAAPAPAAPAPAAPAPAPAHAEESKRESVAATAKFDLGEGAADDPAAKAENVKPAEAPTFDGAAGENTCQPKSSAAKLDWEVKATETTWGVNVTAFTVTGAIKVAPWPSNPSTMTTPNTANPVDGGNITDAAGDNNWKFAIKEMEEYNMADGGRSSYWHSYEASKAHEWAHWNTDYMQLCVGVYWPQANLDLDAITIPKADAKDAAEAKTKLQPKVDTRLATLRAKLVETWNAIPDSPGAAGGAGYKAGQAVLNGLIAKVRAYAASKGWK